MKRIQRKHFYWALLVKGSSVYLNSPVYANSTNPKSLANTYCPVTTDEKVEPDIWLDFENRRVYFCCKSCRKDFIDDPEIYLANIPDISSSSDAESHSLTVEANHSDHQHDLESNEKISADIPDITHGSNHDHDHGSDHGDVSGVDRILKFYSKFHPLLIHFPIALILVALLAEFLTVLFGEESGYNSVSRFCIVLGAIGAVFAASSGWLAGGFANYPGELSVVLFRHRWLGVGTAILTVITAILGLRNSHSIEPKRRKLYRVFLVLNAIAVGLTGHFGATLIYGLDFFSW